MNTTKTEGDFLIYNDGYGCDIRVVINDGELSIVEHRGTRLECTHNLREHPNWYHAYAMINSISEYNKKEFLTIVKLLKKSSQGYKIIKAIAQEKITECDSKISEIMKEANFWKSF